MRKKVHSMYARTSQPMMMVGSARPKARALKTALSLDRMTLAAAIPTM